MINNRSTCRACHLIFYLNINLLIFIKIQTEKQILKASAVSAHLTLYSVPAIFNRDKNGISQTPFLTMYRKYYFQAPGCILTVLVLLPFNKDIWLLSYRNFNYLFWLIMTFTLFVLVFVSAFGCHF